VSEWGDGMTASARALRIVSLIPSGTEMVAALGLIDRLVGRSHECDAPEDVARLPVCTRPAFATEGASREIDAQVRARLAAGESLYRLETDVMARLRPTHIVTQDQCAVCAVDAATVARVAAALPDGPAEVIALAPETLDDVWSDIARLGAAFGVDGRGVADALRARVRAIAARRPETRPRVLCVEWTDPVMAAANWVPEMVRIAGGAPVLAETGARSPTVTAEAVAAAEPDVIVFMPCGFDLARSRAEAEALVATPPWRALRAARERMLFVVDGNRYFNRPGPALADSVEILAEILHPDRFAFGHEGRGWMRL